jgi:hypothetical protein
MLEKDSARLMDCAEDGLSSVRKLSINRLAISINKDRSTSHFSGIWYENWRFREVLPTWSTT